MTGERTWLQRLLIWRVWERLLEIEFLDRSIALAGKAFVSFFPMVIVVAAFLPERARESILTALTFRLGLRGDTLDLARESFSIVRRAARRDQLAGAVPDGVLRRLVRHGSPAHVPAGVAAAARLGGREVRAGRRRPRPSCWPAWPSWERRREPSTEGWESAWSRVVGFVVTTGVWWFTAWYLLLGDVRARVLLPTGLLTAVTTGLYAVSATVWMPGVVEENEAQFGFFGIGLSLVTWFSGAAICILVGACIGPVLAEDEGWLGTHIRGGDEATLVAGAPPPLPPPARELTLRDAFQSTDDS